MANLKKKIYESKKARDILDEEFIEFGPIKRNTNEFFNLYNTKFYDISEEVHKFFIEQSIEYVVDYINIKESIKNDLIQQKEQIQIDIDSIEQFHPIFPNDIILRAESGDGLTILYYLMQSGKRRKINNNMVQKVKDFYRHKGKPKNLWTIKLPSAVIAGLPGGPQINTDEDLELPIYTINTRKDLPSNIYSRAVYSQVASSTKKVS